MRRDPFAYVIISHASAAATHARPQHRVFANLVLSFFHLVHRNRLDTDRLRCGPLVPSQPFEHGRFTSPELAYVPISPRPHRTRRPIARPAPAIAPRAARRVTPWLQTRPGQQLRHAPGPPRTAGPRRARLVARARAPCSGEIFVTVGPAPGGTSRECRGRGGGRPWATRLPHARSRDTGRRPLGPLVRTRALCPGAPS